MRLTKALRCEISDLLGSLYRKNTIKSPKTGDTSNLVLWVALLLVSGTAIGAAVVGRKRIQQIIKWSPLLYPQAIFLGAAIIS